MYVIVIHLLSLVLSVTDLFVFSGKQLKSELPFVDPDLFIQIDHTFRRFESLLFDRSTGEHLHGSSRSFHPSALRPFIPPPASGQTLEGKVSASPTREKRTTPSGHFKKTGPITFTWLHSFIDSSKPAYGVRTRLSVIGASQWSALSQSFIHVRPDSLSVFFSGTSDFPLCLRCFSLSTSLPRICLTNWSGSIFEWHHCFMLLSSWTFFFFLLAPRTAPSYFQKPVPKRWHPVYIFK